jgi:hypothetical protein
MKWFAAVIVALAASGEASGDEAKLLRSLSKLKGCEVVDCCDVTNFYRATKIQDGLSGCVVTVGCGTYGYIFHVPGMAAESAPARDTPIAIFKKPTEKKLFVVLDGEIFEASILVIPSKPN